MKENQPQIPHISFQPDGNDGPKRSLVSRRRAMILFGCAAGLPTLVSGNALAASKDVSLYRWEGSALGAQAKLTLAHYDEKEAKSIISAAVQEINRLEKVFSLHKQTSELSTLNSQGYISHPSMDLTHLIRGAIQFGHYTNGAFDITVQPLWKVFATHFSQHSPKSPGPSKQEVAEALKAVDYRAVEISNGEIQLSLPGMAITLNGIAQGYITDKVTELLKTRGITQVLVELGETRALGEHPEGRPWRIGLADPEDRNQSTEIIELTNKALATSAGSGTKFSTDGKFHHLFDPRTGLPANHNLSVSVINNSAATADAMSTALFVVKPEQAQSLVENVGALTAIITGEDGTKRRLIS